jgi:hypothetical protein
MMPGPINIKFILLYFEILETSSSKILINFNGMNLGATTNSYR